MLFAEGLSVGCNFFFKKCWYRCVMKCMLRNGKCCCSDCSELCQLSRRCCQRSHAQLQTRQRLLPEILRWDEIYHYDALLLLIKICNLLLEIFCQFLWNYIIGSTFSCLENLRITVKLSASTFQRVIPVKSCDMHCAIQLWLCDTGVI